MEKIGRNEACPCGSGKKYKKCCLDKDQAARSRSREAAGTAPAALEWLVGKFPEGVRGALEAQFYGGLKKAERESLDNLGTEDQQLLSVNIGEWLLTDAVLQVDGNQVPARRLLQEPGEPMFPAGGLEWLGRLADSPLSLYEVRSVEAGVGLVLADLLKTGGAPVVVPDRVASRRLARWQLLGARLLPHGGEMVLSGALYPFERKAGTDALARIRRRTRGLEPGTDQYREKCNAVIITDWLREMIANGRSEGEPETASADPVYDRVVSDRWTEEPMDELGGKSPLAAVKTAAGRRDVAEMLKCSELHDCLRAGESTKGAPYFRDLWGRLGLDPDAA